MAFLLLAASPSIETEPVTRIGGRPLGTGKELWPKCTRCGGWLRFLGQFRLRQLLGRDVEDGLLEVFLCPAHSCDPRASGAHSAYRVHLSSRQLLLPPRSGAADEPTEAALLLPSARGVRLVPVKLGNSDAERVQSYKLAKNEHGAANVVGQTGAAPVWLQDAQAPSCACGATMRFVVQLEGAVPGGITFQRAGAGFVFACTTCNSGVALVIQEHAGRKMGSAVE